MDSSGTIAKSDPESAWEKKGNNAKTHRPLLAPCVVASVVVMIRDVLVTGGRRGRRWQSSSVLIDDHRCK